MTRLSRRQQRWIDSRLFRSNWQEDSANRAAEMHFFLWRTLPHRRSCQEKRSDCWGDQPGLRERLPQLERLAILDSITGRKIGRPGPGEPPIGEDAECRDGRRPHDSSSVATDSGFSDARSTVAAGRGVRYLDVCWVGSSAWRPIRGVWWLRFSPLVVKTSPIGNNLSNRR